jgi:hypothetical protein
MGDAVSETGIFFTDIHSAKKGSAAVYYGKFAMVAPVEPGKAPSERRFVEVDAGYSGSLQSTKIGSGSIETAEIIVHEIDADTTLCRVDQGFSEEDSDPVVAKNVVFDADMASCSVELAEHGGEKVSPLPE